MRAKLQSANRRAVLTWRRLRAGVRDTRVTRADLAVAFGAPESDVSGRVSAVRAALPSRLPGGPHRIDAIASALETQAPGEIERMTAQADEIRAHTFDLLGSGPVRLGTPIDWHRDFKSGYRWDPNQHYGSIRFGDRPGVDVKVPWELSRGHHLVLLAQTARITSRAEFADEAIGQMRDWIRVNPPEFGVNWACAMDVGIRAVNWLWTAGLLAPTQSLDDSAYEELLASLLAHGKHLMANLEVMPGGRRTNHYIADLVALLYIGLCVPEIDNDARWAAFAREELAREIDHQVLPDGASFESSVPYHRLVAEMFMSAFLLARRNGASFDSRFADRLERMIEFTAAYTKPNGMAPQIGDADDGRLHVLSGYGSVDSRDHRHLLAAGAAAFGRDDWHGLAGERWIEALWLDDSPRCSLDEGAKHGLICHVSASFPNAGLYVLRAGDDVVFVSAGPVGTDGLGNHKHNDLLAIEVHLGGEDILIDRGSFTYTADPEARNSFRSTGAHNTVVVDREEQNRISALSLFSLHADATPRLVEWRPSVDGGLVTVEHDGYRRLDSPVTHRRTVHLRTGSVVVQDLLTGTGIHTLSWTFVFSPACQVAAAVDGWLISTARGQQLLLTRPIGEGGTSVLTASQCDDDDVSPRYGVRERAQVLQWTWTGELPLSVRFSLARVSHEVMSAGLQDS